MPNINLKRISAFFARFPQLLPIIEKLNGACIPFAIGGSGCLFLFGNKRIPDDVDIYLPDDKHDVADRTFGCESYTYESATENVRNSNPKNDHAIQLTSHLVLSIAGKEYALSLTDEVLSHATNFEHRVQAVRLLPVEDVLLIKALLQRGADVGKHDIEDIQRFLEIHPDVDYAYLKKRIDELGAGERVKGIFPE